MTEDPLYFLPFFYSLTPGQYHLLRPIFTPCEFAAGKVIFEQGEPAERLYIVVNGEVVVNFKPDDGPVIIVARVRAGEVVGWSAALCSRCYTSSAITKVHTQLLQVRGYDLRRFCRQHPDIARIVQDCLATVIVQRARKTHAQVVALLELVLNDPN